MFQVVCTQLSSLRANVLLSLFNDAGDDDYNDLDDDDDSMKTKSQRTV